MLGPLRLLIMKPSTQNSDEQIKLLANSGDDAQGVGYDASSVDIDPRGAKNSEDETTYITLSEGLDRVGHGMAQYRVALVCGLCFMSDSIEIGMLSFLQYKAKDEFDLTDTGEAILSSMVFIGELFGATVFGPFADKYGRWKGSVAAALFVAIMGLASAFSWNFAALVIFRALVGFGIGGLSVPFDILAELTPSKYRGRMLVSVEYFWSIGTMFTAALAWGMLDHMGWRWFVGFCSIPVVLALVGFFIMPESPYWLLTQGRNADAMNVIRRLGALNGKPPFPDNTKLIIGGDALVNTLPDAMWRWSNTPQEHTRASGTSDGNTYTVTSFGSSTDRKKALEDAETAWRVENEKIGTGGAMTSAAQNSTGESSSDGDGSDVDPQDENGTSDESHAAPASSKRTSVSATELFSPMYRGITMKLWVIWLTFAFAYYGVLLILPEVLAGDDDGDFNYPALFISSTAEIVGCTAAFLLVDRTGRTKTMGVGYILCGVFMASLAAPNLSVAVVVVFSMLARASIFLASSITWVATPEMYPTHIRGAGHSWCNGIARIGGAITPFWGRTHAVSAAGRLGLYAGVAGLCGWMSFIVPETIGVVLA
eukprot:m.416233 g.416233  ORF g.416233 m.416233 type:complete len:596 (-) comp21277_c1_seq6:136-1923(-)